MPDLYVMTDKLMNVTLPYITKPVSSGAIDVYDASKFEHRIYKTNRYSNWESNNCDSDDLSLIDLDLCRNGKTNLF